MGGQKSYRGQGGLWALLGRAHRVGPGVADGLHVGLILGQHAGLDKNGEPWIGVYSERAFNVQHGLAVLEHLDEGLQPGLQNGGQRRRVPVHSPDADLGEKLRNGVGPLEELHRTVQELLGGFHYPVVEKLWGGH